MTTTIIPKTNIVLVGTSHIARSSLKEIGVAFETYQPDFIAVELDQQRLHGLLTKQKPTLSLKLLPQIGVIGYLFVVVGSWLQRRLGSIVRTTPGADMKEAVHLAIQHKKTVLLIDRPLPHTLRRLSKHFSWKERGRLLVDIFKGVLGKGPKIKIDLHNVPQEQFIMTVMEQLKDRYPSLYAVLVDERNRIMAKNIIQVATKNPEKTILVVVGEGHRSGLLSLLAESPPQQ